MKRGGLLGRSLAFLMLLVAAMSSTWAGERVEVYSTFNLGRGAKYDLHQSWSIESNGSFWSNKSYVGIPFVPSRDVSLRKVLLPIWHIDGANAYYVSLRADENGVPGAFLHNFDSIEGMAPGVCCEVVSVTSRGIPLTAGQTYWIVVKAKADTAGGWVFNVWNNEGIVAFKRKEQAHWQPRTDVLPAIRILGEAMP